MDKWKKIIENRKNCENPDKTTVFNDFCSLNFKTKLVKKNGKEINKTIIVIKKI